MLVRIIPRKSATVEHVLLGAQLTTSYFVRKHDSYRLHGNQ